MRSSALLAALMLGIASSTGLDHGPPGPHGFRPTAGSLFGGRPRTGGSRRRRTNEAMTRTRAGGKMQLWGIKKLRNRKGR